MACSLLFESPRWTDRLIRKVPVSAPFPEAMHALAITICCKGKRRLPY
jgi:hypothetical protein